MSDLLQMAWNCLCNLDLSKIDSLNYKPADRESEGFSEGAFSIKIGPFSDSPGYVLIKILGDNWPGNRQHKNNQIGIRLAVKLNNEYQCFQKDELYDEDCKIGVGGKFHKYRFYHFSNENDLKNIIDNHVYL